MQITMIKKIKADGSPCKKCAEVEARLNEQGYLSLINQIIIADERDRESEGMQLARKHGVELAPFFIVEAEGEEARIYTIYFKLVKEVLEGLKTG